MTALKMIERDPALMALCDKISNLIDVEIAASGLPDAEYCLILCQDKGVETACHADLPAMMEAMDMICTDWIDDGLIDIDAMADDDPTTARTN